MKKVLFFLIFLTYQVSNAIANEGLYWSNKKETPFTVEQAKKEFGNRKLDPIEGIWFDDGLGTLVIKKDSASERFKMYIIDISLARYEEFNHTWEATFYKVGKEYNFFSRIWYDYPNRFYGTQSGTATILSGGNKMIMDYLQKSQQGREMDHQMTKVWPISLVSSENKPNLTQNKEINSEAIAVKNEESYMDYWWVLILLALVSYFVYTNTVKDNAIKKKNISKTTVKNKRQNTLIKFFRGELSLGVSYWGFLTAISAVFSLIIFMLQQDPSNEDLLGFIGLIYIPIVIYLYVGTWRSARNYKLEKIKKKEGYGWAIAAQVTMVLSIIRMIMEIVKEFR